MTAERATSRPVRYRDASRKGRRTFWLVVPFVTVVVLATLVVVVGIVGRAVAEDYLAKQIEQSLPAGVHGTVSVRLRGAFLLAQYLSGRLDQVDISSDDLTVNGIRVPARVTLQGAPIDLTQPVTRARGSAVLDQAALKSMLASAGYPGSVALTAGGLQYSDRTTILGATIEYTLLARPSVAGGRLDFAPLSAEVRSGGISLDATQLLGRVAPNGLSVCLARYLPQGVAVNALALGDGTARVDLRGDGVVLTQDALSRMGSCS